MNQKEIKKQRIIGKQLMIVDLIHEENNTAKTGFSFVSQDQISKWARMEEDEIDKITNTCTYMDDFKMQCKAAEDLANHRNESVRSNAYVFYLSTYRRFWYLTLKFIDKESIDEYCRENSQKNYEVYMQKHPEYPVDNTMADPDFFKTILEHYVRWFVDCFKNALEYGYDWDVVTRMAGIEISQERFQVLARI